jgi:hypothetical protein
VLLVGECWCQERRDSASKGGGMVRGIATGGGGGVWIRGSVNDGGGGRGVDQR